MGRDRPDEFELIARHFARLAAGFPGAYGLLDDAAVISPSAGCELVVKTDAIVGGVDFLPDTPADLIARKALRVNLSDLAAKGAVPLAYLVDLIVPGDVEEAWIATFAAGLAQDQAEYHVHLIGGDTSSTAGPVTVAVTVFGEIPLGQIIRRGGARPGDRIFVTGTIGDAALGLQVLLGSFQSPDTHCADYLVSRCRLPLPRVALGPHLVGIASAAADVSDGLIADLGHICAVSNLGAVVEGSAVPLSPQAVAVINGSPERFAAALTGGDDYEVVFAASPAATPQIEVLSRTLGIRITPIGRMTVPSVPNDNPVIVLDRHGEPLRFESKGWTHFGARAAQAQAHMNTDANASERHLRATVSDALVLVDVQNDFLPGGALAVPSGDTILDPLNRCVAAFHRAGLPVFATRDWHPPHHCSFREEGGRWAAHCVAGTPGAEFPSKLVLPRAVRIISKGGDPAREAYSGFHGTDLAAQLRDLHCRRLFIGGLATDYCVRATVKDALAAGFEVVILVDAVGAVDLQPGDGARALEEMFALGARSGSVAQVIGS